MAPQKTLTVCVRACLVLSLLGVMSPLAAAQEEMEFASRELLQWQWGSGGGWLREQLKLPKFSTQGSISGTNPITKETKSLSYALASGGAEAQSASLAKEVKENGEEATAQTYAQALSDGQSAAVALSFASSSQKGGEEAKAASRVLARTFGKGNPAAIATAMGEAYTKDRTAVAQAISEAIVIANGYGNRRAVAESTAEAIAKGGSQAEAFSAAYADAVSDGKCDQVADAFAEAIAIAEDNGKSIAEAIAEAGTEVADCAFKKCGSVAQSCCQWFSINRGKCFCPPWQNWCNWKLLTKNPFPIWETNQRGWARNRYCKCR